MKAYMPILRFSGSIMLEKWGFWDTENFGTNLNSNLGDIASR